MALDEQPAGASELRAAEEKSEPVLWRGLVRAWPAVSAWSPDAGGLQRMRELVSPEVTVQVCRVRDEALAGGGGRASWQEHNTSA